MSMNISDPVETKRVLRSTLKQQRQKLDDAARRRQDEALIARCVDLIHEHGAETVAAYHPLPDEPGGPGFLPALRAATGTVLLPISEAEGAMLWAPYEGEEAMAKGDLNIPEPVGERRDWRALLDCDIVFLPALGANRRGFRLGKGAGYYDRTLARLAEAEAPQPLLAVVLFDHEVTDDVPVEAHDMPVNVIVTAEALHRV